MHRQFRQQPMAPMTTSPTASPATEVAREAVIASGRKIETATVTGAATESDVTVIAAVTGTAAAAAPQTPRGHHAVIPAATEAVGAAVGAGTATTDPRDATGTGTIIAVAAMAGRALGPRAAVSTALETATIGGIIGNAENDEMMTEIVVVVAGPLARIKTSATLLRRN